MKSTPSSARVPSTSTPAGITSALGMKSASFSILTASNIISIDRSRWRKEEEEVPKSTKVGWKLPLMTTSGLILFNELMRAASSVRLGPSLKLQYNYDFAQEMR